MLNINYNCIKVREGVRTHVITVKTIIDQETGHVVETEIHLIEVKEVLAEIIDQIIEVDHGIIPELITNRTIIGMTTDKIIIEITTGKTIQKIVIEIKDLGIEVEVGMDIEITTDMVQERTLNETGGILVEIEVGKDNHHQDLEERKTEEIVIDRHLDQGLVLDLVPE